MSGATGMDGGGAGEGGSPNGLSMCDPAAPKLGCVLAPGDGIFVATKGSDSAAGTQARPVKTIAKALVLAAADPEKPIYVCTGTYAEHLVVKADGIGVSGGYSCAGNTWTYDATRAQVAPGNVGEALKIDGVEGFAVRELDFTAKDATAKGGSSVAVFVKDSQGVKFTKVRVTAGKGMNGEDGTLEPYAFDDASKLNGESAEGNTGGSLNYCSCDGPGPQSIGGAGGSAIQDGAPGQPAELGGGRVGTAGFGDLLCTDGSSGNDAVAVGDGPGAETLGTISVSGWVPASGSSGPSGAPGQGGGGGGGAELHESAGGGGACGGCGGSGGAPGAGGGGSIAILVGVSEVVIEVSTLETADAGRGGNGTLGQPGQPGGIGGEGFDEGCRGGDGGRGASGGAAGGGVGGVSVGVLSDVTSEIFVDESTQFTLGAKGRGGYGAGADNDGIAGIAQRLRTN